MLKKKVGRASPRGVKLIEGLITALVWTLMASLAVAWMLSREVIRMEQTGYFSMAILLVCGLIFARKAGQGKGKERLMGALLGAGLYFLCLLLVNWLFFGGEFAGFGATALVLLAGTLLGSLWQQKGRGGRAPRRYKIPKA